MLYEVITAVGLGTITDNDPITAINLTGFTESETDENTPQNFVASMDIEAQENIIISFTTTEGTVITSYSIHYTKLYDCNRWRSGGATS